LAAAGATIILTSRDASKGEKAVDEVTTYLEANGVQGGKVMVANLDLCDLENVKTFKNRLEKIIGDKRVDVLMNNAGVMAIPDRQLTKDGYEKTFQTNHLVSLSLRRVLYM
jgi:NAD(P)-dependent dehydrogenase (short-subunit alcohol dehydrogenase family)